MRTVLGSVLGSVFGSVLGAAFSIAMARTALAADLPVGNYYTVPPSYSASSWAGPYLGAQFGYEWGTVSNNPTRPDGFQGGVEAGYNWQFGQFVVGGEADLNISGAQDTSAPFQFANPWYGTIRGRAGVAFSNVLLYGTAGLGYGALNGQSTGFLSASRTSAGFVGGAGIEYGFASHWSAKAEWLYLDLADRSFPATGTSNGLAANLVRFGLNYHF
jgi:outer membrane immunogenic protein